MRGEGERVLSLTETKNIFSFYQQAVSVNTTIIIGIIVITAVITQTELWGLHFLPEDRGCSKRKKIWCRPLCFYEQADRCLTVVPLLL